MKVAIIHDYLNQLGGAERVVGVLHEMYPDAPIFTTILEDEKLWPALKGADIRTTWMQRLPGIRKHFKKYLPLYPSAIESIDLSDYDIVISSSSAFAKSAITRPDATHICYCYTPMRFAWDYKAYMDRERVHPIFRVLLPFIIKKLQEWDIATSDRPTKMVAISTIVAERIRRIYNRESDVVFPPVEVERFNISESLDDYYLVVSRLNPYKRIDLAIKAFTQMGKRLVVIGDGPDKPALQELAGTNIEFLGRLPDSEVNHYLSRCQAFIFPGEEDFGIAPLEANASGRPVIAFHAGGSLDTVNDGVSGLFFYQQTPEALIDAVCRFEQMSWDNARIRENAERFSEDVFVTQFSRLVNEAVQLKAQANNKLK